MADKCSAVMASPIGTLLLEARSGRMTSLVILAADRPCPERLAPAGPSEPVLVEAQRQLDEYFAGRRTGFDLPVDLSGCPPFTRKVLETLQTISFGLTIGYGALAARVGSPRGARAVGRAMARNPLPVIISCHRVVAADGQPGGYSGGAGLPVKMWLLALEQGPRR